MAGFIKVEVEKLPTQPINTQINSEIFEEFQKKLKRQNIPMNVAIETFARQYASGEYEISEGDIIKWKDRSDATSTLNTPINKDVYYRFKDRVKTNRYFVKHVLSAFIEDYAKSNLVMQYVKEN